MLGNTLYKHQIGLLEGAAPSVAVELYEDFRYGLANGNNGWTVTESNSSVTETTTLTTTGPTMVIATVGDYEVSFQQNAIGFTPTADTRILFSTSVKITDVSATEAFFGLATASDTSLIAGVTNCIGFVFDGSTENIMVVCEDAMSGAMTANDEDTGTDAVDATYVALAFEVVGTSRVNYYIDGALSYTLATDIPDGDILVPSLEVDGNAQTVTLKPLYWGQGDLRT